MLLMIIPTFAVAYVTVCVCVWGVCVGGWVVGVCVCVCVCGWCVGVWVCVCVCVCVYFTKQVDLSYIACDLCLGYSRFDPCPAHRLS